MNNGKRRRIDGNKKNIKNEKSSKERKKKGMAAWFETDC